MTSSAWTPMAGLSPPSQRGRPGEAPGSLPSGAGEASERAQPRKKKVPAAATWHQAASHWPVRDARCQCLAISRQCLCSACATMSVAASCGWLKCVTMPAEGSSPLFLVRPASTSALLLWKLHIGHRPPAQRDPTCACAPCRLIRGGDLRRRGCRV